MSCAAFQRRLKPGLLLLKVKIDSFYLQSIRLVLKLLILSEQARSLTASYFLTCAMTSISTRASRGSRATWTVERAGGVPVKCFA